MTITEVAILLTPGTLVAILVIKITPILSYLTSLFG